MKTLIRKFILYLLKPFAVKRLQSRLLPFREGSIYSLKLSIDMYAYSKILHSLGEKTIIHPSVEIRHPHNISVGSNTRINHGTELHGAGGIKIGDDTLIAFDVMVFSDSREYQNTTLMKANEKVSKPVIVGNDVWIGARAIILPGITIEDHSIIGAGSVVTRNVSKWQIVAGNPAKVIGSRIKKLKQV